MSLDDQLAAVRRQGNIHSYNAIIGIMGSSVVDSLPLRVRCECSVTACEEIIDVSLAQRRELRRDYPRGFIVVAAHAGGPRDVVLHQGNDFGVVEKPEFTEVVKDL